jgi:glutamine cyclotransferase
MKSYLPLIFLILFLFLSCSGSDNTGVQVSEQSDQIPVYDPIIHNIFPHDANAYTQGLFYTDGSLYESTGLYDPSPLRQVEIESGSIIRKTDLNSGYFIEGITLYDDKIIQLTYTSNIGFVYDKETFQLLDEFNYSTEGWGLTYDGEYLIMSDGTDILYYLDPENFQTVKEINVSADGEPVNKLNELEYINGNIYANVYLTDRIAIIQPDGEVIGWIDLEGILLPEECTQDIDVLNGIAYNPENNSMYVTGKYWCKLFELEVVP